MYIETKYLLILEEIKLTVCHISEVVSASLLGVSLIEVNCCRIHSYIHSCINTNAY